MMLPEQWEIKSLGSVFPKIVVGYVGNVNDYYCSETEGVPFYRTLNIRDGYFRHDEVKFVTEEFNDRNKKSQIVNNDILIARVGANLGMVCKVSGILGKANIANAIIIKSNSVKNVDVDFFTYFLLSSMGKNQIYSGAAGGAQGVFNTKLTQEIKVPVPPLPEQIKIADILSTWDNAINTVQKLLANSQQQKKSLMQQLLTGKKRFSEFEGEWEGKRLSRLLKVTGGNAFKSESFADTGVPLIKISNIKTDFSVSVDSCVFHPYEEEFAKFNVQYGDILIAMSGATTGKVGRYFGERLCYLNQRVGRFDLKKELASSDFIFQILKLPYIQHEILIDAVGGAQPNISNKEIERIKIKAPSLAEQQKIADVLTTADQEIDNLRAQLNHLKQEKKALMQQLLTGKRRVKIEEAA